jgi:predicted nucleic acid-binding protein
MILLDTNVVLEPLRLAPDPVVLEWLDRQSIETLYLSAISLAELRYGVSALPKGKRREGLGRALEDRLVSLFAGRVLPFDESAATAYAAIRANARKAGKAVGATDGYIAATAAAHGFAVATRDTAAFEAAGVRVIDPWVRN